MIHQLLTDPDGRERSVRQVQARTMLALARVEAVRLVRHPLVWLGVAFGAVLAGGVNHVQTSAPVLHRDDAYVALVCAPMAVGTFLAVNLAITRARRNDADAMFAPTPTVPPRRTIAHLVSLVGPVGLAVAVAAVWLGWAATRPGAIGTPGLVQSLQGPALVFTAGAIGIMVGRWTPARIAAVLIVPVLGVPFMLGDAPGWSRWLAWFRLPSDNMVPELTAWPVTEHLVYLIGVGLLAAGVAQLRHGPNRRRLAAGGVAMALVAASVLAQARVPTEGTVAAAFDLAEQPSQRHVCTMISGVTSCVWPGYEKLVDLWTPLLSGVLDPLPAELRPDLRVEMRPGVYSLMSLTASISSSDARSRWRQRIEQVVAADARRKNAVIVARPRWPGPEAAPETRFAWALAAATRSVKFDTGPTLVERQVTEDDEEQPTNRQIGDTYLAPTLCTTGGQARAVLALWLAAQTTDDTAAYARQLADPAAPDATGDEISPWWIENDFVAFVIPDQAFRQWTIDDLDLAVQLLDRPHGEVVDTITPDWEHWTDPATTSVQLQQALNLHQPRTAEHQDVWRFGGSDNPSCA